MDIPFIPPWLANKNNVSHGQQSSPSVTLTLSPTPQIRSQTDNTVDTTTTTDPSLSRNPIPNSYITDNSHIVFELMDCCREMEEGHKALMAHKKESAWRLKGIEQQLEGERDRKRKEKREEIEGKVRALRDELNSELDRIESEHREQIAGLRRDAQVKEQKLADIWASKHIRLTKFLEQVGCRRWTPPENL